MGQKTHPVGFRLGITKEHKSKWYANFNKYASILEEDDKIRTYLNTISQTKSISRVQINRNTLNDQIQLHIYSGNPGLLIGDSASEFENLRSNLKKIITPDQQFSINIVEIEKVDLDAVLLANLIAKQLEKRIAFKLAIREALQRAQKQNVNGIKIQVSGRLNGAEIARKEWVKEGRVPLQTLRADIDYATQRAHTIYGILGIKVWLFKGEILSK